MPITYTNRKGQTYLLQQGATKTGKTRYYFSQRSNGMLVEQIPPGFEITESVNGVVSLTKIRPRLVRPEDQQAIQAALQRHPASEQYRAGFKPNQIDIYERVGPGPALWNELLVRMGVNPARPAELLQRVQAEMDRYAQYTPVMRFIVHDPGQHLFQVQRMCYRGSMEGWITLCYDASLTALVEKFIPVLGTDKFFELF